VTPHQGARARRGVTSQVTNGGRSAAGSKGIDGGTEGAIQTIVHLSRTSLFSGLTWLCAVACLSLAPACEGDLAIELAANQQGSGPPPSTAPPSSPPRILPDQDAGPGWGGSDAGTPAPPTPQDAGPPACIPDCDGRECGDDGCGGFCGVCQAEWTCSATFQCEPPVPPGPEVTLYGAEWCGYCRQAKRWFQDNDVEFTDRDLDQPGVRSEAADHVESITGSRSVSTPTIVIDDNVIHGWDENECRRLLGL